jgi:hypothetical protein
LCKVSREIDLEGLPEEESQIFERVRLSGDPLHRVKSYQIFRNLDQEGELLYGSRPGIVSYRERQ